MPKIIMDLPQRLSDEARRQVLENGYSSLTIRSVAAACGVSIGAVYNYYPSKEALTASFMLKDWKESLAALEKSAAQDADAYHTSQAIYRELRRFTRHYQNLFRDAAAEGFAGFSVRYQMMLRSQLSIPLRRHCQNEFTAEFIAEALITWTVAGKSFAEIWEVIQKLFSGKEGSDVDVQL